MNLFEVIEKHLSDGGLTDGYQVIWYRFRDEHTDANASPFICMRRMGGGVSDELGQEPTVLIQVCGHPNQIQATEDRIKAIKNYLICNYTHGDIVNYGIAGDIQGPYMFENDRPLFELNVNVMAENGL